ncbi:MAG: translocation/assembly module TamB domain-containing protein [bacterium]
MRYVWKTLRVLLVTAFLLALISAGGLLALLKWPQWVVNPKMFARLAHFSSRFGAVIGWDSAEIYPTSYSLFHKRFDFSFNHFCFNVKQNTQQGCLQKLQLGFEIEWKWKERRLKILDLGPLVAEGADVSILLPPAEKKKKESLLSLDVPDVVLPPLLQDAVFRNILLDFKRLEIKQGQDTYSGSFQLSMEPVEGKLGDVFVQAALEEGFGLKSAEFHAQVHSDSHFLKNDWLLTGNADLSLPSQATLKGSVKLYQVRPGFYSFEVGPEWAQGPIHAQLSMNGSVGKGQIKGAAGGEVAGFSKQVHRVTFQKCAFDLRQLDKNFGRARFTLDCPLKVGMTPVKLPSATATYKITLPENLDFIAKTNLETSFLPSLDKEVSGTLDLQLIPVEQQDYQARGTASIRFSGVPSRYPSGWSITSDLDASALIPHLQRWVKSLNQTAFAVPAPLNPLEGTVTLGVKGKVDIARNLGELPVVFKTELKSKDQTVNTDGKGTLKYQYSKTASKSDLTLDLMLSDLVLSLPRFGYSSLPTLFPDKRFYNPNVHKKVFRHDTFDYHVRIQTSPEHPARLVSNLAKENIPLSLDLNLENEKLGGSVQVGKTPLHFFRRDAEVERFKIVLKEPQDQSEIRGRLRVSYVDYKIDIIILGTVGRPTVLFQSDPPLSQDQVLSVLIYGRTFDDLDENKANSVASASAAFADKAIALGSLFLLASTPIESIGYNPSTGLFSAKIRLAEGTSLNLATQEGKTQQAGIRKNLGGNWIINTYIQNDTVTNKQSGGAMLEWNKRY